jgi:uncharacterized protein YebE (UPF0316 family)
MPTLDSLPIWLLGLGIFFLRIIDVPISTVRTISMIQGRARLAVTLAFFEVLVWVTAISQVVLRIQHSFWLAVFYAAGFSAGTGVGMLVERRVSLGRYLVRIISRGRANEIAQAIAADGRVLATFPGTTPAGPATLVFVSAIGRRVPLVVAAARAADPEAIYTVEPAAAWSENVHPAGPTR